MDIKKIAVTHASGLMAEALLESMAKSGIASDMIVLLDNVGQAGNRLSYADTYLSVSDQHEFDYENLLAVLLLEPDSELEDLLQHADCYVVSHHTDLGANALFHPQLTADSSLPESPCAIQLASAELASLLLVTQAIHRQYGISTLNVVNVLSAAYYGQAGVDELASQTISLLNSRNVNNTVFPLQLAFNMIPVQPAAKLEDQLMQAMDHADLRCSVQQIMVPAFHGMAISVAIETVEPVDLEDLSLKLENLQGVQLCKQQVSPVTDCKTGSDIMISGLYQAQKDANRVQLWIVADSVRNGLIQNYLNIMEILLKSYL